MNFTIQSIEGQDAYPSTLAFVLSEFDQLYFPTPWTLESWRNLFTGHDRLLLLLLNSDEIKGFCLFDKQIADSFGHLLKIVIHPDNQSKGLSRKLLKEALTILEGQGIKDFFLEVEESNLTAQKLYFGEGFTTIHRKKDFYGQNRAALIMTRKTLIS